MVVGRPGVGKTSCIQTLLKTISAADGRGSVYRESRVNPKSMTVDQLFGSFSATTGDWVDGVFSVLLRRATRLTRGQPHCVYHSATNRIPRDWTSCLYTTHMVVKN